MTLLLERNPADSELFVRIVEFCANRVQEKQAADFADGLLSGTSPIQSGASLVATLVRNGGLTRHILANGEPYEGTMQQLQADETLPADAPIEYFVEATPAATDVSAAWRQTHEVAALLAEFPQFADGFLAVLASCSANEGKTTQQLQDELIDLGIIKPGLADAQQLHASYFTSKLQQYGALVWDRKRWHATPKGEAAIAS